MSMIDEAVKKKATRVDPPVSPKAAAKARMEKATQAVAEMRARHRRQLEDQADERRRLERELTEAHRDFHRI